MEEDHSVDGIGESLRYSGRSYATVRRSIRSRQIACSDVVLVNKTDLVPTEKIQALEHLILQVNPAAIIHRTVQSNIDLRHIMGIDAYTSRSASLMSNSPPRTEHHDACDDSCAHEHHSRPHHYEVRGISSLQVSVPLLRQESFDRLDEWIRTVLWESRLPEDSPAEGSSLSVLRCKGIFQTYDGVTHVLQGVRNLYEISATADDDVDIGVPDTGKLVFIGKGLDERVRNSLMDILRQASVHV